jgi:hypothetical protein
MYSLATKFRAICSGQSILAVCPSGQLYVTVAQGQRLLCNPISHVTVTEVCCRVCPCRLVMCWRAITLNASVR